MKSPSEIAQLEAQREQERLNQKLQQSEERAKKQIVRAEKTVSNIQKRVA